MTDAHWDMIKQAIAYKVELAGVDLATNPTAILDIFKDNWEDFCCLDTTTAFVNDCEAQKKAEALAAAQAAVAELSE